MTPSELSGVIVPLVTPFSEDELIDVEALRRLIAFLLDQGVDALMPTALTGEGTLLTNDEILFVWDEVFRKADGLLPIAPAILATTTRNAINLTKAAEAKGAAAIMVAPILPELYVNCSHEAVYGFYADIAMATSLPIILFNYPIVTGFDYTPSVIAHLTEIENIRYIKESTGDVKRIHSIQRMAGPRISTICGTPNVALESLALGCQAWITGIMNLVPRSCKQLIQAIVGLGDLALARRVYYKQILPLVDLINGNHNPVGSIKAGLTYRGVNVGAPRSPGTLVSGYDVELLQACIAQINDAEVGDWLANENGERSSPCDSEA